MLKEKEIHIFEQTWTTSCLVTKEIIQKFFWDEHERLRKVTITERELRSEIIASNEYNLPNIGGKNGDNNRGSL